MARLIDADALLKDWNGNIKEDRNGLSQRQDTVEIIKRQPTAYDVDKVVEELEKYLIQMVGRESILYAMIIQIVKEGGCNDK